MNLATSAYGSARPGLRDVEVRAAPAAEGRIGIAIADWVLSCSNHGDLIDGARKIRTAIVDLLHRETDCLLAQRFGHSAGAPLQRAALNVVLLSRMLRCLDETGASQSDAVVFANALLHMNALATRRADPAQPFQTAVYQVEQPFVGENANLGAMSILVNVGGVSGGGASILKVDLAGATSHPLYLFGKPPRSGHETAEALHTLSERLMLGMLVADGALAGAAVQHRTVLAHYLERAPDLSAVVASGLSALRLSGVRTLWGVMIRHQSDAGRQAANTTPRQFERMIDAIARVLLSRTAAPGTAGIVFFGDRLPAELERVARACLKELPVFDLTEPWRDRWGDGKGLALDLRGQAVLYATLVQQHGLVAIVGNKSGGLDLPAHVGVPTVQVGPLTEGSDPFANRIGLLSLVSDSWSFVPAPVDAAIPPGSGASDPTCEAIAACLDRAWQRHPPR